MQASVSDKVDLHGGVTTGVVDGTGVNLGNGHFQSYFRFLKKPVLVSKYIAKGAVARTRSLKIGRAKL